VGYKDKPKIVDIQKHNRNEAQNVRKGKKKNMHENKMTDFQL